MTTDGTPLNRPYFEELTYPDRTAEDENFWLEDMESKAVTDWVSRQNERTINCLDAKRLDQATARIKDILDAPDRIPAVTKCGPFYYNFWKDADHPRGQWRRTTPGSYRTDQPKWDVLLDLDELSRQEDTDWVFEGVSLRHPDYDRALIELSPDGRDAVVVREFDLGSRQFVPDGFTLPAAKTTVSWADRDTVLVSTDFGPGSMSASGYPRQAKRWRRGQSLADAELVFEVPADHIRASAFRHRSSGIARELVVDTIDFYRSRAYLVEKNGQLTALDVPENAVVDFFGSWLLVFPRTDWLVGGTTYPAGSALAIDCDQFLAGERQFETLFSPDPHTSLLGLDSTKNCLLLTTLRDVRTEIAVLRPTPEGWHKAQFETDNPFTTVLIWPVDDDENDDYWLSETGFLQPSTLRFGSLETSHLETVKTAPSFFDSTGLRVEQYFATSADGTRIPYFQVGPKDLALDGTAPTWLTGYGGFEVSKMPSYSGSIGREWLNQGGVYVVANIRGGGEYGPAWHQAALQENRPRAYEDFAAVAQDLIRRGVTSPRHLGCDGASNGGLLVGNMLTHYPDLFGAISCGVPLLDMKRYSQLFAGASWIAEYGDPQDPAAWEYIQTFSPYHNLRPGVAYPAVLFTTATSDDRVGPVHARKMAARMQVRGIPNVYLHENQEGGHAGAADNTQRARLVAIEFEFMRKQLFTADLKGDK